MGKANNPQLERERTVYSYLDALESGDIDGIIESLQQAVYDAPLDQMLVDAHQAYFQEEQVQQDNLAEIEAQTTVSMPIVPLRPREAKRNQKPRRRTPVWLQTLAAVLVVGALVGSFMAVLAVHNNTANSGKHSLPALPACYPLHQFDAQSNITSSASYNTLSSVATISANDAWAVGFSVSSPSPGFGTQVFNTFIEHWDGKHWYMVSSPNSADGNGLLHAVAAVSANDVWAVGYSTHDVPSTSKSQSQPDAPLALSKTLIEHWDGKSWQVVPSGNGQLNSLAVISQNDIWAVGAFADAMQQSHPLLEHWDGTDWQQVVPEQQSITSTGVSLTHIVAISANDIWAVGSSFYGLNIARPRGLVLHWNGSQWQTEPTPPDSQILWSVSAHSAQDVWVAGAGQNEHPLVEHWDGQQWRNAALPDSLANVWTSVRSIRVVSANDVWAVGYVQGSVQNDATMLILHWNGTSWQQLPAPALQVPPSGTLSSSSASALAISDGQMWIVGSVNAGDGEPLSVILGQHTCP